MSAICEHFDAYYDRFAQDVHRLCLVLTLSPADAKTLTFNAFLRLGAAKDAHIGEDAARSLLFQAAIRQCEDYYLRKFRRPVKRSTLEEASLPFPVTDSLWALMQVPFKRRAALCLIYAGFTPEQACRMSGLRRGILQDDAFKTAYFSISLPEDALLPMSDNIYARFAERSVGVENRIHGFKSALDRIAPYLALLVIALCAYAVWLSAQVVLPA